MSDPYLYLLHMTGTDLYKIGIATRPHRRLEQITGRKYPVKIIKLWPGLAYFERALHKRFAAQRAIGAELPASGRTEWFRFCTEEVNQVLAICYCERLEHVEREKQKARARFE